MHEVFLITAAISDNLFTARDTNMLYQFIWPLWSIKWTLPLIYRKAIMMGLGIWCGFPSFVQPSITEIGWKQQKQCNGLDSIVTFALHTGVCNRLLLSKMSLKLSMCSAETEPAAVNTWLSAAFQRRQQQCTHNSASVFPALLFTLWSWWKHIKPSEFSELRLSLPQKKIQMLTNMLVFPTSSSFKGIDLQ